MEEKKLEVIEKDLVVVNAAEYGLDENRAKTVKAAFIPMLHTMEEYEKEYNAIKKQYKENGYTEEIGKAARELRLKYVKVRTGTAEIHKKQKAYYRNGGLFIDAWKNTQKSISDGIESELSEIENYYDILTKKIEEENRVNRFEKLKTLDIEYIEPIGLGSWEDSTFNSFFAGEKLRIENEAKETKRLQEEEEEKQRIAGLQTKRVAQCSRIAYLIEGFETKNFGEMSDEEYKALVTDTLNKERLAIEEEAHLYNIKWDEEKILTDKADTFVSKLLKDGYEKRRSGDYIKSGNTISYESLKTLNKREFGDLIKKNNELIKAAEDKAMLDLEIQADKDNVLFDEEKQRIAGQKLKEEQAKLAAAPDKDKLKKFANDISIFILNSTPLIDNKEYMDLLNESIGRINLELNGLRCVSDS